MAGVNPYIQKQSIEKPRTAYELVVFCEGEEHVLQVDPARLPYGHAGQVGSILDICEGHDIPLEHTCGGVVACSTCHIIVTEGLESCNEATDDELDQLDEAPGLTLKSRLGCQCVPNGNSRVVVEVPGWNRNAVKETPH
jgi:2Fe-2S ferredoxin